MRIAPEHIKILLIGVRDFDDTENLHSLPAAYNNVNELYNIFISEGNNIPEKNISLYHGENKNDILKGLSRISKAPDTKLIIIYYAGHGIFEEEENEFYLSTSKSKLSQIHIESISINDLNKSIHKQVSKIALILDCCYSERAFDFLANRRNYFLLASSPKVKTSKYPIGSKFSAFTKELVRILKLGIPGKDEWLSFNDIYKHIKETLDKEKYPEPKKIDRNNIEELQIFKNLYRVKPEASFPITIAQTSRERYLLRFYENLKKQKVEYFIDLEIIDKSIYGQSANNFLSLDRTSYSLSDFPELLKTNMLAILGAPGAGKTTILSKYAIEYATQDNLISFLRMGQYRAEKRIIDLIDLKEFRKEEKDYLLNSGKLTVILDGVNEAPREDLDKVFDDIIDFTEKYPGNKYIISCRVSEFPDWVREYFTLLTIQPISEKAIRDQFISSFGKSPGENLFNRFIVKQEIDRFKELCQNPLLLSMFISVYKTPIKETDEASINLKFTRTELYTLFIEKYEYRERIKRRPFPFEKVLTRRNIREDIISYVSFLLGDRLFMEGDELFDFLAQGYNLNYNNVFDFKANDIKVAEIFRSVSTQLPFKVIENFENEPNQYTYIHQSFHEYYYALYLAKEFERGSIDNSELNSLIEDSSRRKWEILIFLVGLSSRSREIIGYIIKLAKSNNNQSFFLLASKCLQESNNSNRLDADDLIIRMIEAFKYWDIPFDYELIHSIKDTLKYKSNSFPKRIAKDLNWFVEKYAKYTPIYIRGFSTDELIFQLEHEDSQLSIDCVYTLGKKEYLDEGEKRKVVNVIVKKIKNCKIELREHLVIALKELKSESSIDILKEIVNNKKENEETRGYALNALGAICDLSTTDTIVSYLLDHDNKYRDSASWSLQQLGLKAKNTAPKLFAKIKKIYWDALVNEACNQPAISAKGNLLYSLSKLNATEYADKIIDFLKNEQDEYVLEDGINAIGTLGGKEAVSFLIPFLNSDDPLVRMKTIESLVKLNCTTVINQVESISNDDPYPIVRDAASYALKLLAGKMKE